MQIDLKFELILILYLKLMQSKNKINLMLKSIIYLSILNDFFTVKKAKLRK